MAQTGKNVSVRFKVESTFNTAPGTSGGEVLRIAPSPGMALQRASIQSQEVKSDGIATIPRYGSRSVPGSYNCELSVDSFDTVFEALMRSTWVASVAITQAAMTSITTTTSTIVAAAGSWITQGVREGDLVRLSGHATAANNDINLRVKTVTASTITVVGTPLTADAVADTAFTLTVLRKLKNGSTPTRRTYYVEEYMQDNDISEVFGGVRFVSFKLSGSPDGMASLEIGVLGASYDSLGTGASPYYTAPTSYTTIPLVFVDAAISIGGNVVSSLSSFEFTYSIAAATMPVIGSTVSPDVFDNDARISGSFSILKADSTNPDRLDAETEFAIHILLEEPDAAAPKDCVGFYIPRCKVSAAPKQLGSDNALVESVSFEAGLKESTSSADQTLLTISTSAS